MKNSRPARFKGAAPAAIAFAAVASLVLAGCFGQTDDGGSGGPGGGAGGGSAGTTGTPGIPEVVAPLHLLGNMKGRHAYAYDFLASGKTFHWTDMGADFEEVKPPAGEPRARALGVSRTGALVGTASVSGNTEGFFWSQASADPVALPIPSGYSSVTPMGINSSNQIVGSAMHADGEPRPCFWPNPTTTPVLLDVDATLLYGVAVHINDAGVIGGRLYLASAGQTSGTRWSNKDADASLLPVGTGVRANLSAIGEDGTLVGTVQVGSSQHAAKWQPGTGALVMLPEPPGSTGSYATSIEGNIISGYGVSTPFSGAIFWENGTLKYVSDFLEDPAWSLIEASGIGPDGLFLAVGIKQGESGYQTVMVDIK